MADFLGNIMAGMAGPPKASDKEIAERKKARELAKKIEIRNKQESKDFRLEIDKRIDTFLKLPIGDENRKMVFEAMPKGMYLITYCINEICDSHYKIFFNFPLVRRAIVHDVSETAGLVGKNYFYVDPFIFVQFSSLSDLCSVQF